MPGGRPTKYNELTMEVAENYLRNYESFDDLIPSHIGLALVLGISTDTLYRWGNDPKKPEFSCILERILKKQHQILINKSLSGEFNSNIAKLVLGKHGYHDQSKVEQSVTIHEKTIEDLE